jgi:hypothetical protein
MTEAGKRLTTAVDDCGGRIDIGDLVAAIEAEAVTAALTALRARVEGMDWEQCGWEAQHRDTVLAALDEAMPK